MKIYIYISRHVRSTHSIEFVVGSGEFIRLAEIPFYLLFDSWIFIGVYSFFRVEPIRPWRWLSRQPIRPLANWPQKPGGASRLWTTPLCSFSSASSRSN